MCVSPSFLVLWGGNDGCLGSHPVSPAGQAWLCTSGRQTYATQACVSTLKRFVAESPTFLCIRSDIPDRAHVVCAHPGAHVISIRMHAVSHANLRLCACVCLLSGCVSIVESLLFRCSNHTTLQYCSPQLPHPTPMLVPTLLAEQPPPAWACSARVSPWEKGVSTFKVASEQHSKEPKTEDLERH